MNLVKVATWIQEGYAEYYQRRRDENYDIFSKKDYVMRYVMEKGNGHFNPKQIDMLIDWENSVSDEYGFMEC
jgi:hypothetical protein